MLNTYCHNSKTIRHRVPKLCMFGKVFALAFQTHENHFYRYYESKLHGLKYEICHDAYVFA